MTGYFMDISPGSAEGRRIWISPNGLIVVGMAIFYVDMWKSGINDVFAFLDERVADEQKAPPIDDLWREINERFGEMLINFRIALLDARSGQPLIRANGSEPLVGFYSDKAGISYRHVADCQSLKSGEISRYLFFCGELSVDALKKTGEQFMTITDADFMRHSMVEATESTDWAAVVFPPLDS